MTICFILYILNDYELFKANARFSWGSKYRKRGITLTEAECAEEARSQGVKLFLICENYETFHCYVYIESKSVNTCSTSRPISEKCSIYRMGKSKGKEGNINTV